MYKFISKITGNHEIAQDYHELSFFWECDKLPEPGQFITIKTSVTTAPLLRRPFALSAYCPESRTARIIYQRRGDATRIMTALKKDEQIDIIGPLGNNFPINPHNNPVLVAGGIGLGPMLFLASRLAALNRTVHLVFGARNRYQIPLNILEALPPEIVTHICTDDGSSGFQGTSVDFLKGLNIETPEYYSCGPNPMMKAVHEHAQARSAQCWVSMEQIMGCGVGACMGCAIEVKGDPPYARACKEGPVFNADTVVWE